MSDATEVATRTAPPSPAAPAAPSSSSAIDASRGSRSSRLNRALPSVSAITSPAEALDNEERTRTRLLGISGFAVNAVGALALPVFGGSPAAQGAFLLGLVIHAIGNFGLFYVAGSQDRFTERRLMVLWCMCFVGLHLSVYYFGTLTVAAIAHVLGLYIVSTSRFPRVSLASYAVIAIGNGSAVGLELSGVIPAQSLVPLRHLSVQQAFAMLALVQAMFLATRFIGLIARKNLAEAMDQLSAATRAVAQREALLEEAREEFRRVMQVGGRGRFSAVRIGDFELGVVLGRGGMGEIYDAVDVRDGSPAAVKVLQREAAHRPSVLERFFRECAIVQRLESPHIVRLLGVGGPPEEVPFMAMELLRGEDLASHLGKRRVMSVPDVAQVIREVGAGLAAAAAAGVVHRDIKPHNIFRLQEPQSGARYKVLDFGISKLAGGHGTLTQGQIVGTPSYMAPEQAMGGEVTPRTDLYALGAVAYRSLVGQPPYRGKDTTQILLDVVQGMPMRPSALAPLHPHVDAVFAIALARLPEDRFEDAARMADALEAASAGGLDPRLLERAERILGDRPWRHHDRARSGGQVGGEARAAR